MILIVFFSKDISYYIISLGCAKNLVDSEKINGQMASAGFISAHSSEDADIIIINTCGFITPAKEESIEVIFDAIRQQKAFSGGENKKEFIENGISSLKEFDRKVVACGCLTQRYFNAITEEIPELDFLYGLPDNRFVKLLSGSFYSNIDKISNQEKEPLVKGLSYSYIKISDGCSNNCSYCAIPLIKGKHVSSPLNSILTDAENAALRGAKEMVIVANDISAYQWKNFHLNDLVEKMSRIRGVEWIRLMYCHPDHLDENIINVIKNIDKVVRYIDIPFQHASKKILDSMGRKGSFNGYLEMIGRLRRDIPDIRIRSTFIVGYPGEGDTDFEELVSFLKAASLDRAGAFIYSPEEGTEAFLKGNSVPERVKRERYEILMNLQQEISSQKLSELINGIVNVIVEERLDGKTYIGRTEFDAPEVDGIFYLTAENAIVNSIVSARVTDAVEHDLIGEII